MAAKSKESKDSSSSEEDEEGRETPQLDQTEEEPILLQGNNNRTFDGVENDSRINNNVAAQQALMEANIMYEVREGCIQIRAFNGNDYEPLPGWTTSGQRIQQCTEGNPPWIGHHQEEQDLIIQVNN
ncbi:uncharacterized protein LOC113684668 [Pocillopora damicornis]|uniref:uncharacterized protein LOC113684668 n=1 Tax=Pocillopora damicornis TaxID=46731 RepID=UPI000F5555A1|nr:uncharacterized protein LOC113684668 [Pocillopora damicornis]